jgi:hypothetical protein
MNLEIRMTEFAAENGDDEQCSLENMFHMKESNEEYLLFHSMQLGFNKDNDAFCVEFNFRYCEDSWFQSRLFISSIKREDEVEMEDIVLRRIVFSLGMNILLWFWMGFATDRIIIDPVLYLSLNINQSSFISYWQTFYDNILAEYYYVNKLFQKRAVIEIEIPDIVYNSLFAPMSFNHTGNISKAKQRFHGNTIVPLGGNLYEIVNYDFIFIHLYIRWKR